MRYRLFLIVVVLSLTLTAGCGKTTKEAEGESALPTQEPVAFVFDRDNTTKVTIYRSDDQLVVELTDSEKWNTLAGILDHAQSFSGAYPSDLSNKIVIESQDGIKRKLLVTGNGNVFEDQTAKIAYKLDRQKFEEFVAEWSNDEGKNFVPGNEIDFPTGADPDEQAVIDLVKKTIEAMVNKDKEAFHSNLEHPDNDYLDFLIDSPRRYRFTELEMIEPYDESTGRKNLRIRYEYEEDGIVNQSGNTFTSRKNKEGKWKIANID
ncbi:hypothetical protein [Cohnella abietis]|uniref:Uncharacterized protein n=1 Tax=Cohnella abietis TaxID=2507935 RepID=A0A3T1DDX9_9BACL|nr:hypothetical protein [Cohnella abietis]BBI36299.1 hypothetical protein KCTCHS21_56980 [Cohnella abietis]